jgi:hypothetical protein
VRNQYMGLYQNIAGLLITRCGRIVNVNSVGAIVNTP